MGKLLIAGSTGTVGSRLVQLAVGRPVKTLSRSAQPGDHVSVDAAAGVGGVCEGIETVFSALGASVSLNAKESRGYREVDTSANLNLITEARRAGVRRFVYVSAHVGPGYAHTAYIRAHEEVVEALRASGLFYTIVRPTGIFTALDDLIGMARRGFGVVIGSGKARANPVHPQDVAQLCFDCLDSGPLEISIGGPEILTRRQIVETAFEALGRPPRIRSVPAGVMRFGGKVLGLANRRKAELLEFAAAVSTSDSVAPTTARRILLDYFRERARLAPPGAG